METLGFIADNWSVILRLAVEHISIVAVAVGFAILTGLPIGIAITQNKRIADAVLYVASIIVTIPSIALFGLMIPVVSMIGQGIGWLPAVIAILLYSQLPIVRNTYTAITNVDPALREAAKGMGMTSLQRLWQVEIPIAVPVIMAGVRTAVVMNIGVAAIAAYIGAGGLGVLISRGISQTDYHVGGMQAYFIPHLLVGGTNVAIGRYDAHKTLATIASEKITTLFAVPTQIQEMLFHPDFAEFDVSSLRLITTGGAAISTATMERVMAEFCPGVFNGYGMTEASLALVLHPEDGVRKLGSCGKPTLISECRIVTDDQSREVPPSELVERGTIGQLIVRGAQAMQGYWNNPFETQKKLKAGWVYTGDLFSQDAEGFYYFHGRADDMIISGGENIYPREVEEILYRCPGVKEAAVVGLKDEKWGQIVTAFIVKSDPHLTAEQVDAFCKGSEDIAPYKRPKRYEFLEQLPFNPSGKVLKRELVARFNPPAAA